MVIEKSEELERMIDFKRNMYPNVLALVRGFYYGLVIK